MQTDYCDKEATRRRMNKNMHDTYNARRLGYKTVEEYRKRKVPELTTLEALNEMETVMGLYP